MEIINSIGNIFLSQAEFWWFASLLLFAWVWTVKTDNVDTAAATFFNDLQDLKVDTDRVPIMQNILGGSLFGTWSQSDANKGLATLVYDNLAGGAFAVGDTITGATSGAVGKLMTDNGATSMTLGAVTGCFQDNEQIGNGAGVTADVNGDTSVGVSNDPCNNDSTADWTQDGDSLNFNGAGFYEWATSAVTKYCYKGSLNFTKGKIYKIEIEMKDGTASPTDLQIYFYDGAEQVGWDIDTGGAFVKYTWTFECATTTAAGRAGIKAPTSLGGNDIEFRRFSCYEITPCCTTANDEAWDGDEWTKDTTLHLYREHWDGGTNTKEGSFYALKCVPTAVSDWISWRYAIRSEDEHMAQFYGRTAIMGMWVKTSVASHFRINMYEGPATVESSDYHTGGGAWEWLEVPITFGTAGTYIYMQWGFYQAPNVDGSTIVYCSQPMLIFGKGSGSIIGEGNYRAKPQEMIWLKQYVSSMTLDAKSGLDDIAWTDLNVEADSDARLPKGCKSLTIHSQARDSASAAGDYYFSLRANSTGKFEYYVCSPGGLANSRLAKKTEQIACDEYGDIDYYLNASAPGNFDIVLFRYLGVQVN